MDSTGRINVLNPSKSPLCRLLRCFETGWMTAMQQSYSILPDRPCHSPLCVYTVHMHARKYTRLPKSSRTKMHKRIIKTTSIETSLRGRTFSISSPPKHSPNVHSLPTSRSLLFSGRLFERHELLGPERLIVDLRGRFDQILEVRPEDQLVSLDGEGNGSYRLKKFRR